MVLGIIVYREPVSGYGIERALDEWAVSRWTTIAPASVYQQLRTLSAQALIKPADGSTGRAAEYRSTQAGREELHSLLLGLLAERDIHPMSLIPLLHFTPSLSIEELDAGLAVRISAIDDALALENDMLARSAELGPSHVSEIFRLTWHGLRADRSWCQEFRQRLTATRRY